MLHGTRLAAVDLGSNSFRLEIVRLDHGQFERTEYLKEAVRQGAGLDSERNLKPQAMQRGWDCLARFGERLAGFDKTRVRAVATQTLREARNSAQFLLRAQEILGFSIDVISGREEARLIYRGVSKMLPQSGERRLVADIGGRSTELIIGQGTAAATMESYRVGSITWSSRYFPDGQFTKTAFQLAEVAAKAVLDEALSAYRRDSWDMAYGSAGTIGAVGDMLHAGGWPQGSVSQAGLDWLLSQLLEARSAYRLQLPGMGEDRRPIIGGGLSVLRALFDLLEIGEMQMADGGLRHGVLCELLGDQGSETDLQQASVNRLAAKFDANPAHGRRVGQVAVSLFDQVASSGPEDHERRRSARKLQWAAQLHEIGAQISHSDSHKHGAYILDNADMLGFSQAELHRLSLLVLGHRGKLRKLDTDFDDDTLVRQLLALRLAVILCHARRDPDGAGLQLSRDAGGRGFTLRWPEGWSDAYPQSAHLLREEVLAWKKTPWQLGCDGLHSR